MQRISNVFTGGTFPLRLRMITMRINAVWTGWTYFFSKRDRGFGIVVTGSITCEYQSNGTKQYHDQLLNKDCCETSQTLITPHWTFFSLSWFKLAVNWLYAIPWRIWGVCSIVTMKTQTRCPNFVSFSHTKLLFCRCAASHWSLAATLGNNVLLWENG